MITSVMYMRRCVCTCAPVWVKQHWTKNSGPCIRNLALLWRSLCLGASSFTLWVLVFSHAKWNNTCPAYLMSFVRIWDNGCALKSRKCPAWASSIRLMRMFSAAQCYLKSLLYLENGAQLPVTKKKSVFLAWICSATNVRVSSCLLDVFWNRYLSNGLRWF